MDSSISPIRPKYSETIQQSMVQYTQFDANVNDRLLHLYMYS